MPSRGSWVKYYTLRLVSFTYGQTGACVGFTTRCLEPVDVPVAAFGYPFPFGVSRLLCALVDAVQSDGTSILDRSCIVYMRGHR